MSDILINENTRILDIHNGEVLCLPKKLESVEKCRFCVHSKRFREADVWKISPARAYCSLCRGDDKINFDKIDAVECDDLKNEGYRSILNIIS